MATLVLSAVGAALGSAFGGSVLGLTSAVVGRAIGATLGRAIDQKILGAGSEAVEYGKVDRFRVMGASEGTAVPQVWGRVRVSGQVIWSSRFQENINKSGGGKGSSRPGIKEYSYTVSLAIALCEGEILRVGRVWADGNEIRPDALDLRVYKGSPDQLPDPKIEAVEGAGLAPAYRGTAYVVIEDLNLSAYGNRVPQFSFEVIRLAQGPQAQAVPGLAQIVPGLCLIPGTGEYALATTPVHYAMGLARNRSANVNTIAGKTDFSASLDQLVEEMPACETVSVVSAWFGGDLRCGSCLIEPKVEQRVNEGVGMAWRVSGLTRGAAKEIARSEGRSIYGGTPADKSVVEAISALKAAGKSVTFTPFILMDQVANNDLPDPWTGVVGQPALPWRGRITLNAAPGTVGSTDTTATAGAEVAAFFGAAQPAHFHTGGTTVSYSGPQDWRYRRFILHYAYLCAAAGGVDAFCIGSEMRALTQIRGSNNNFPAVDALRVLATEVKSILGSQTKITYAADWSEYFGYHVGNDVIFHLDPLWADPAIDFIGIDNYMPLSDWRDGAVHADADWGAAHNIAYLKANIAGGEGFDWYYPSPAAAAGQLRAPIQDGAHGEDWVFRYKDLRGWWSSSHHNRINGARSGAPTAWIAGSKPIRFTEFGCAAIDKGTNQPSAFVDVKSSESALPAYSNGLRDDAIQLAYFSAMHSFWTDPANNPQSQIYPGAMVDFAKSTAWAWDARPFPAFPVHDDLWSDGINYDRGHWLNGRSSNVSLAAVIDEICATMDAGLLDVAAARGIVRGYGLSEISAPRAALQPLMLAYPTDATEREGKLHFASRTGLALQTITPEQVARSSELQGAFERTRAAEIETPSQMSLTFLEAEADFAATTVTASAPDGPGNTLSQSELPLALTQAEATMIAERWMAETRIAREAVRFALPRSMLGLGAGDCVKIDDLSFRIDRLEQSELQLIDAIRVDPAVYQPASVAVSKRNWQAVQPPMPVFPLFLDLPMLRDTDAAHAPFVCVAADPWPGPVAVWSAASDDDYRLNKVLSLPATIGITETAMGFAEPGRWDNGPVLRVRLESGSLASASQLSVLSGGNTALIGDGSPDNWEVFQFASASLVAPQTYDIKTRLRGQAGTNAIAPQSWPVGSMFVLFDDALQQIDLATSARDLTRSYRFAPADQGYDAATSVLVTQAFSGIGLRPYSVAHLGATRDGSGTIDLHWTRRTRLEGDTWSAVEVPLGEEAESYQLRVTTAAGMRREVTLSSPRWSYDAALQAADAISGPVTFSVAQLSQRFGAGPFRALTLTP